MKQVTFLSEAVVRAINTALVQAYGGAEAAVRDANLLGSALARPQNFVAYVDSATIFDAAASLAYGLVQNHPFVDGNKRTAATAMLTFLRINGWDVVAPEAELVAFMVALAAGDAGEAGLAIWLEKHSVTR